MHILVVDDEDLARQRLIKMLSSIDGCEVVGEATTGKEALLAVEATDPDLVLMDVRMPELDGLEAARAIAQLAEPPAIIFCTAYDQYALQAFDVQAVGYLVKPVGREQLLAALEKAQRLNKLHRAAINHSDVSHEASRKNITAKTRRGVELVPIDEVLCFIADQKYVTMIHAAGETLIDDTLKDLENELGPQFMRVHRNALVAVKSIAGLEKTAAGHYELVLKDREQRPMVSRRHLSRVKTALNSL